MSKVKKSWDLLPEEKRRKIIEEIIRFFSIERNEEVGVIAAEEILDMFLQKIGVEIYNLGVEDAKNFYKKYLSEIEAEVEISLKK